MIDLDDPNAVLLAASAAFQRAGIDALAYGGLVLAMYGEARETKDADLAVASVSVDRARDALVAIGLGVNVAFAGTPFGGNAVTRLTILRGSQHNTVDLVEPRSARFAEAMMARGLRGSLRGQELRVVTPEDFVVLKILSTRDRDLEDARSVITALADRFDAGLVDREVALLTAELPEHDVAGRHRALAGRS